MTHKLFEILSKRFINRSKSVPWVFYRMVWSKPEKRLVENPYKNRSKLIEILYKKADVKHFGYHAIRHSGASIMDSANVPIGSIQRILGHENRSTTEIYLHSISNADREAMKTYEQSRQNAHTKAHTADNSLQSEETYN